MTSRSGKLDDKRRWKCEGEGEGKIKGRGTRHAQERGLHMGWRGTGRSITRAVAFFLDAEMLARQRAVLARLR